MLHGNLEAELAEPSLMCGFVPHQDQKAIRSECSA